MRNTFISFMLGVAGPRDMVLIQAWRSDSWIGWQRERLRQTAHAGNGAVRLSSCRGKSHGRECVENALLIGNMSSP